MSPPVLTLSGPVSPGPDHWMAVWAASAPFIRPVDLGDWAGQDLATLCRRIDAAVASCEAPPVLVGHDLGCHLIAAWARQGAAAFQALMLVAPPDPDWPDYPAIGRLFLPLDRARLPGFAVLVAGEDDPAAPPAFSRALAADWSCHFVTGKGRGHLDAASGLADWPRGRKVLGQAIAASGWGPHAQ